MTSTVPPALLQRVRSALLTRYGSVEAAAAACACEEGEGGEVAVWRMVERAGVPVEVALCVLPDAYAHRAAAVALFDEEEAGAALPQAVAAQVEAQLEIFADTAPLRLAVGEDVLIPAQRVGEWVKGAFLTTELPHVFATVLALLCYRSRSYITYRTHIPFSAFADAGSRTAHEALWKASAIGKRRAVAALLAAAEGTPDEHRAASAFAQLHNDVVRSPCTYGFLDARAARACLAGSVSQLAVGCVLSVEARFFPSMCTQWTGGAEAGVPEGTTAKHAQGIDIGVLFAAQPDVSDGWGLAEDSGTDVPAERLLGMWATILVTAAERSLTALVLPPLGMAALRPSDAPTPQRERDLAAASMAALLDALDAHRGAHLETIHLQVPVGSAAETVAGLLTERTPAVRVVRHTCPTTAVALEVARAAPPGTVGLVVPTIPGATLIGNVSESGRAAYDVCSVSTAGVLACVSVPPKVYNRAEAAERQRRRRAHHGIAGEAATREAQATKEVMKENLALGRANEGLRREVQARLEQMAALERELREVRERGVKDVGHRSPRGKVPSAILGNRRARSVPTPSVPKQPQPEPGETPPPSPKERWPYLGLELSEGCQERHTKRKAPHLAVLKRTYPTGSTYEGAELPATNYGDGGALVVRDVKPDGPAARAGLRECDIVLEVGGLLTPTLAAFHRALEGLPPLTPVRITVQGPEDACPSRILVTPTPRPVCADTGFGPLKRTRVRTRARISVDTDSLARRGRSVQGTPKPPSRTSTPKPPSRPSTPSSPRMSTGPAVFNSIFASGGTSPRTPRRRSTLGAWAGGPRPGTVVVVS